MTDKPENPPLLAMPNYTDGDCVWLRDYFAAAALQGLLQRPEEGGNAKEFSALAYQFADAMLAARRGGGHE